MRILLLSIICFILQINSANSEVYKWTDENGKTVYGDKPLSENADIVEIKKKPTADKTYLERIEKQKKLLDVMEDERDEKIAAEKEEQKKKEEQEIQCAKIQKELQESKDASALYEETDDPDNPRILSNEEREAEEKKYDMYIKEKC